MLSVTENFRDLMYSNIRPKCVPIIKIKDALGVGKDAVFTEKNISNLKYKRSVDPLGRTLPYMELKWTEIFDGKLNKNDYQILYQNATALLKVEFGFEQSIGFFNTWKTLKDSKTTWKTLKDSKTTWNDLKNKTLKEKFVFPTMFLYGKPKIKNSTIEWEAYDFLYYLNLKIKEMYDLDSKILKIPSVAVKKSAQMFLNNKPFVESIIETAENFESSDIGIVGKRVVLDGELNSCLKDFISLYNRYIDFNGDGALFKKCFDGFFESDFTIPLNLQYENPIISKNNNVSSYRFSETRYFQDVLDESKKYKKKATEIKKIGERASGNSKVNVYKFVFDFDGFGTTNFGADVSDYKKSIYCEAIAGSIEPTQDYLVPTITPFQKETREFYFDFNSDGEEFIEKNNICCYGKDDEHPIERKDLIQRYFNKNCDSLEINCVANVALEPGDIISVETDLQDGFGKNITKKVVIIENSLEYSGTLRQKIKAHEIEVA